MRRAGSPKPGYRTSAITRRGEVRRVLDRDAGPWHSLITDKYTYLSGLIWIVLVAAAASVILWARNQPMVRADQIMSRTFAARVDFGVSDRDRTREMRDSARQHAPRVYVPTESIEEIRQALLGLPEALAGHDSLDDVNADLVRDFALTPEALLAFARFVDADRNAVNEWKTLVDRFVNDGLRRYPLIASERWQFERITTPAPIRLRRANDAGEDSVTVFDLIDAGSAGSPLTDADLDRLTSPLPADVRPFVRARLRAHPAPTFILDEPETRKQGQLAASDIPEQFNLHTQGEILYVRGDRLTPTQYALLVSEYDAYRTQADPKRQWIRRLGIIGIVGMIATSMASYIAYFYTRLLRQPGRLLALVILMAAMLALSTAASSAIPGAVVIQAVAPTLLVAMVMVVAFDQRFAMGVCALYAVLVCVALDQPAGFFALLLGGIGVCIWQLREIRDRNRLLQAGAVTGTCIALGSIVLSLLDRPYVPGFLQATIIDAVGGASAGVVVGVFTLGVLSSVERVFNVTTSLTLVELRDPMQPLLRELQQRAPGTWTHSVQVANIAEAAADEIGADSLLTYVGALYHDVGKMNKPQYFVENQSDGVNRHERLSPAMSLLIIVGHVKDGIEMAREFGLPKPIHHFIEAHHGTTLVEYFYRVAREKVEAGLSESPVAEVEYRYPGPKPRTKEVAIVMLADAVESTARSLADPMPIRIEQMVRAFGQKRLLDDQFDDCDLTLRELRLIEDSLIRSLSAIYHARISYPVEEPEDEPGAADHDADQSHSEDDGPTRASPHSPSPTASSLTSSALRARSA